jgi:hypothetical protein
MTNEVSMPPSSMHRIQAFIAMTRFPAMIDG